MAPFGSVMYFDDEAEHLYTLAKETPWPLWIVEIGSYRGFSGMVLAAGSIERPVARLALVDIWGLAPPGVGPMEQYGSVAANFGALIGNAQKIGLMERLFPLRMTSLEAAAVWPDGADIGLLHIDGEHTYEACAQDIRAWQRHLATGAMMVVHDYEPIYFSGVVRAVDEVRAEPDWEDFHLITRQASLRWKS